MKKTKQDEINELRSAFQLMENKYNKKVIELNELDEYFNKVLFNSSWNSKRGWEEIKIEVADLKGQVKSEGKLLPLVDWNIKEENSKLWYLIRVAMNDKSITEPHDFNTKQSKFKKPDFN